MAKIVNLRKPITLEAKCSFCGNELSLRENSANDFDVVPCRICGNIEPEDAKRILNEKFIPQGAD